MKRILICLFALLGVAQGISAQDEIIDLSAQNYTNAETVTTVHGTNCTITFDVGTNSHSVISKYYVNGAAVRVYAGNTMTVTTSGSKKISEINLVFSSGGNSNAITVNYGTYASGTWTGDATEVTFTVGGYSGHRRVQKVEVTYMSGVATPVISGNTSFEVNTVVTMTAEEGATIRYTTDGSTPTSSSTIYGSLTLTKTSTVKAIAIKDGVTSNVATMLFVKDVGLWTGSGTKVDPFIIDTPEKLDQLATRVNAGDPFDNTYFQMTNDISYSYVSAWNEVSSTENNYTRIGTNNNPFKGVFDGDGHTISGIRVYDSSSYNYGLFGYIDRGAVVKTLTLADCRFTAGDVAGAIVGRVDMGTTVENCHVLNNVCIHDKGTNNWHGGVVGYMYSGTVTGCTSSATLSIDEGKLGGNYGGIVGRIQDGTLVNCLAIDVKLPVTSQMQKPGSKVYLGTIVGYTVHHVANCLYSGCTFGDEAATVGIGDHSLADNGNEALPAIALAIGTDRPSLRFDADEPNPDVVEPYTNVLTYKGIAYMANNKPVNLTLNNRTFLNEGNWNTLCLPFDIEDISSSPLAGATVKELDTSDTGTNLSDEGTLTLQFSEATRIEAGKPYIIKWISSSSISDPEFSGVTITSTSPTEVTSNDQKVKFVGQYSPFSITEDNINEILYLGSNNKIGYSQNLRMLMSFRAHFWVQPKQGGTANARVINIFFDDEMGITTGIENGELKIENYQDGWFSIDGRKLNRKPTKKGVYIVNGKRVVIQ